MTYTTTLAALRQHDACIRGYNKLVCALTGAEYHAYTDEWIECDHDAPIALGFILESNGLDDALWALRAVDQTPEFVRDCRLFAVWRTRQMQHLMTDPRSLAALDVVERHAYGQATDAELAAAWAAWAAARDAANAADAAAWAADAANAARDAARDAANAARRQKFIEVFCGGEA